MLVCSAPRLPLARPPSLTAQTVAERWATFDCYGTLIDWEGGLRASLSGLWPDRDVELLRHRYHQLEPIVQDGGALPYREVQRRTLQALAAVEDLPLAPGQDLLLAEALPGWPAFVDVPPALTALRAQGWRLAILSNTDPDFLAASLAQIGVPIDVRISAADAGSYKPALGHWQAFYARTGASPSHHVHVAASAFHDLAPAATLGIPAVWINREVETSDRPRAAELPNLSDLPATLERLVPAS
jgi:2-haloacid dehalogenase